MEQMSSTRWRRGAAAAVGTTSLLMTLISCGPDVPPRAQFAAPESPRVTLALQQEGPDPLVSLPRSFLRPSSAQLGEVCRSLLAATPLLQRADRAVRCLELGPMPAAVRSSADAANEGTSGVLNLALTSEDERLALSSWLASGRVVLSFPQPSAVSGTPGLSSDPR